MRVVHTQEPHMNKIRGDHPMENKRPLFQTKIGNTDVKIHSALPSMNREDRARWFQENETTPEVQNLKRIWINTIQKIEEEKLTLIASPSA